MHCGNAPDKKLNIKHNETFINAYDVMHSGEGG
jgi:hypothetical protein